MVKRIMLAFALIAAIAGGIGVYEAAASQPQPPVCGYGIC